MMAALVDVTIGLALGVAALLLGPGLGLIALAALAVIAVLAASLAVGRLGRAWRVRRPGGRSR